MTEIRVKKKHGVLVPALPEDELLFESLKAGEIYGFDFKKKRNGKFHNKWFALLSVVMQHTEDKDGQGWVNIDAVREEVLKDIGHCELVWNPRRQRKEWKAKSIAWAKMDEAAFNRIYQDSLTVIVKDYLPGWDKPTFDQALNEIMDFA